jgi:hypothetical protein
MEILFCSASPLPTLSKDEMPSLVLRNQAQIDHPLKKQMAVFISSATLTVLSHPHPCPNGQIRNTGSFAMKTV